MTKGRCIAVMMALALSFAGVIAMELPASAHTCATTSRDEKYDGYSGAVNTGIVGANATITVRTGGFCSPPKPNENFYYGWTMIASADGTGWAQAGFLDSSIQGFALIQWAEAAYSNAVVNTYAGPPVSAGSAYTYSNFMDWTCGCARSYIAGFNVISTMWNPYSLWSGSQTHYYGSVGDYWNTMPGTAGAPMGVVDMTERPYLGSWTGTLGTHTLRNDHTADGPWYKYTSYTTCLDGYKCFNVYS